MLLLSSADTAPASVAVLVTAVKIETLAVSAAGTAQFLALSQTSKAILLQQLSVPAFSTKDKKAPVVSSAGPIQFLDCQAPKLEGIQA